MKTLLLLGMITATAGAFWVRAENIKTNAKTHEHALAMLAEMRSANAVAKAEREPGRVVSFDPATGHYVEHDRGVSVIQSRGGGSYAQATPAATPVSFPGFKGTALDEKSASSAKRGR